MRDKYDPHPITDNPDWPTRGAPDAISAGHAAKAQMLLAASGTGDPVAYIMAVYEETREQAETIVKNCQATEDE